MGRAMKGSSLRAAIVVVMLLALLPMTVSAEGATVVVQPASTTVQVGESTTINIRIDGVTDLYGAEVHLTFSPSVVQVTDSDGDPNNGIQLLTGDLFAGKQAFNAVNSANNSTGAVAYAISLLGEPSGVTGSGTLFSIQLEGSAAGLSAVAFVNVMLASQSGGQISATTTNGTVTVATVAPTDTPTTEPPTATPTTEPATATPTTEPAVTATPTGTPTTMPPTLTPTPTSTTVPGTTCSYTVQWGDTLYSIARRNGTTVSTLASINGIADPSRIYVGQVIILPCGATPTATPTGQPPVGCSGFYHTVVAGNTLSAIAAKYGTTVSAIVAVNYIPNPNYIYVGQKICIPTGGSTGPTPTPAPGCSANYAVQPGDTLSLIAAKYGTTYWAIAMANNISNPNLIYPGTTLCIP
jgi:LysM repeat protein